MLPPDYTLRFIWQEKDGKLKVVYCDEQDVPVDTYLGWGVDNVYIQMKFNEISANYSYLDEYAASVTVNKKQKVQMPKGRFLYMDVGRWLDGKQSFGLICGDDAMVCDYDLSSAGSCKPTRCDLINKVLEIPGVSYVPANYKKVIGPNAGDSDRLIVILPDMHVPGAPPLDAKKPERPSWWGDGDFMGNWREDPKAFERANQLDFFNSRASINAMVKFLKALRYKVNPSKVVLVQIGDMYELWAGHSLEYVQTDVAAVKLRSKMSAEFVGSWIGTIHDMHADLFEQFDICNQNMMLVFLHGNHDSYLDSLDVVAEANAYIEQGKYPNGERVFKKTTVYPRLTSFQVNGVYMEHGQRVDGPNRDGSVEGWQRTNSAFDSGKTMAEIGKKLFDTTRRRSFVTGAAAQWVVQEKNFGCYVMGHTHSPELKYVEVIHQRGSISLSGGKIHIQTSGAM